MAKFTLPMIEEILEKHFEDSDGALPSLEVQEDEFDDFAIFENDLTTNLLEVDTVTLVDGNLTVDFIEQFSEHSLLIVLGNLTVKRGVSISQICVLGDLTVEEDFYFDSMSQHDLFVVGSYTGGRLWLIDHEVHIGGEKNGEMFEDGKSLNKECLEDGDGLPSAELVSERLKDGLSILKS